MRKALSVFVLASLLLPPGNLAGQNPGDSFVDSRDGQRYPVVQIGGQVWMARNLNFNSGSQNCYDHDPGNCVKYGALYTWEESLEVCPSGWHLPSRADWEILSKHLGVTDAGQKLKASSEDPVPWDGSNETGFTALSSGAGNGEGFHRMGDWALFWSSTESNNERAWFAQLDGFWYEAPPKYTNLYLGSYYLKTNQFSVRCIKDQD